MDKYKGCDDPRDTSLAGCAVDTRHTPSYHRITSRIGDLAITLMEDGGIGIKKGKEVLTTTASELQDVISLAANLHNYKRENGLMLLKDVEHRIAKVQNSSGINLESLNKQREDIKREYGV